MSEGSNGGPGLRVPPPLVYLLALTVGLAADQIRPLPFLTSFWRYVLGATLIALAGSIMPAVLTRFRRAQTTFDVRQAASALITDGPYRFSRNPSYVGLSLLYAAVGVLVNSGWVLALLVPLLLFMHFRVIPREEAHLEAQFGASDVEYKSSVRRWL